MPDYFRDVSASHSAAAASGALRAITISRAFTSARAWARVAAVGEEDTARVSGHEQCSRRCR